MRVLLLSVSLIFCASICHAIDDRFEDNPVLGDIVSQIYCLHANPREMEVVRQGNQMAGELLQKCLRETGSRKWCPQILRPNPSSVNTFMCTYGAQALHQLIDPERSTWNNAVTAVRIVQRMEAKGICMAEIYNWWRPEPYNHNVGGAAGRHPYGTAVDVRACTMRDMERAHKELCKYRAAGEIRAVGYYGSTGLHIGVGDRLANTWGKGCP